MRLLGERHWLRGTRLALGLACVVLLACAASASAVTRYASPTGAAAGTCAIASPCELQYAVENAAGAGDEVRIAPGTYSITSTIVAGSSKVVRGDGPVRPRLVGAPALFGAPVTIDGGASIIGVRIESQNSFPALDLNGVGTNLELYSSAGNAARMRGASELTTAIVSTSAPNATALDLTDPLLTGATVAHATIVATGSGSTGLDVSGLGVTATPTVISSIVNGASTDVAGDLLSTANLTASAYRVARSTGAASDGTNINAAALLVNPPGDFQQQATSPTVNAGRNPDGAAVDLAGNPRSIGGAPDIGALELPIPPDVSTDGTTAVTATSATIHGSVATRASDTDFQFIWGTSNPPSTAGPLHSLPASAPGGAYSENVAGLKPGTTYYYRVVATNPWGTTEGAVASFATPSVAPTATTKAASLVAVTSARLNSSVNAGGAATTVEFQWGTAASYGNTTGSQSVGSGTDNVDPVANLSGLLPNTDYHFRVVATNSNGTVYGADLTFKTAPAPPDGTTGGDDDSGDDDPPADDPPADDPPAEDPDDSQRGPVQADGLPVPTPAPPVGESANAAPSSGTVRVRVPGSRQYVELTEGAGIPIGSIVDASEGEVVITSASDKRGGTQTASFTGSEFKLVQKKAAKPITDLVLTGGDLSACSPRSRTKTGDLQAAGRRKWSRRRLWGNGHGRFRTRGRYGTATVRGTWWLTEDRCDGTFVRVKRGLVEVRDLTRRKTVMVPAGKDYFAKSPAASNARAKKKTRIKRAR
jgi:hypothetical protein